ncbi:hypothetical protein [Candidatus Oleimmundimicrobium sp.]|uniref:hypothetical protein n=1 Tax=Candidatus Oleimmundimicrobium sp. TaxID=3060597 RepID=UPI002725EFEA|nr:hypothetical protein [Candidatus Oleimmundimicrobium sp.]MDO8886417.1 hypothetical protein [Candidatus Oleimmundimicrobium sp.]
MQLVGWLFFRRGRKCIYSFKDKDKEKERKKRKKRKKEKKEGMKCGYFEGMK